MFLNVTFASKVDDNSNARTAQNAEHVMVVDAMDTDFVTDKRHVSRSPSVESSVSLV